MSRNYLILGASSDVGIELIKQIMEQDNNAVVWAHYCSSDERIREIEVINGNEVVPVRADFSNPNDVKNLFLSIQASGKLPTAIVHLSAPKLEFYKLKDISWDDCIRDTQIQVGAVFQLLQLFLPKMVKTENRAKLVFMLSENTINNPAKFSTKYTMSKYMLLGLMKSLAVEYEGKSIDINALSPSMIDTKFLSNIDRRMLEMCGATEHMLKPKDVALWLWKLVSEYSDGMSGENILLTGGQ